MRRTTERAPQALGSHLKEFAHVALDSELSEEEPTFGIGWPASGAALRLEKVFKQALH